MAAGVLMLISPFPLLGLSIFALGLIIAGVAFLRFVLS
jgi:hypothetical protein